MRCYRSIYCFRCTFTYCVETTVPAIRWTFLFSVKLIGNIWRQATKCYEIYKVFKIFPLYEQPDAVMVACTRGIWWKGWKYIMAAKSPYLYLTCVESHCIGSARVCALSCSKHKSLCFEHDNARVCVLSCSKHKSLFLTCAEAMLSFHLHCQHELLSRHNAFLWNVDVKLRTIRHHGKI
jgi:hypothetical protein